jgi:ubiquinone/menaquinone biosynthesis C-methylase UbiE
VTDTREALRECYDAVAEAYAARFRDELTHKPLDRALLRAFADIVGRGGEVADVGCGPGQVADFLRALGLDVTGFDLSAAMIEVARRLHPGVRFEVADMLALPVAAHAWDGVLAFYSIIHLAFDDVGRALREFHRVLRPSGVLLVSFHLGDETRHVEELFDKRVDLDFHFLQSRDVSAALTDTGFTVEMTLERTPYVAVEAPTRRGYILARAAS